MTYGAAADDLEQDEYEEHPNNSNVECVTKNGGSVSSLGSSAHCFRRSVRYFCWKNMGCVSTKVPPFWARRKIGCCLWRIR